MHDAVFHLADLGRTRGSVDFRIKEINQAPLFSVSICACDSADLMPVDSTRHIGHC